MKNLRLLALGAGAALLPFAVVAFFTWARTGAPADLAELCGRGELFPAAALLSAQAVGALYGAPVPRRTLGWHAAVGMAWAALAFSSAGYTVPYSSPVAPTERLALTSLVMFAMAIGARAASTRWEVPP